MAPGQSSEPRTRCEPVPHLCLLLACAVLTVSRTQIMPDRMPPNPTLSLTLKGTQTMLTIAMLARMSCPKPSRSHKEARSSRDPLGSAQSSTTTLEKAETDAFRSVTRWSCDTRRYSRAGLLIFLTHRRVGILSTGYAALSSSLISNREPTLIDKKLSRFQRSKEEESIGHRLIQ